MTTKSDNVQETDGWLRVFNPVWEALARIDLSKNEWKAIRFVIRYSWGCGSQVCQFRRLKDFELYGLSSVYAKSVLAALEEKDLLLIDWDNKLITFNKHFHTWAGWKETEQEEMLQERQLLKLNIAASDADPARMRLIRRRKSMHEPILRTPPKPSDSKPRKRKKRRKVNKTLSFSPSESPEPNDNAGLDPALRSDKTVILRAAAKPSDSKGLEEKEGQKVNKTLSFSPLESPNSNNSKGLDPALRNGKKEILRGADKANDGAGLEEKRGQKVNETLSFRASESSKSSDNAELDPALRNGNNDSEDDFSESCKANDSAGLETEKGQKNAILRNGDKTNDNGGLQERKGQKVNKTLSFCDFGLYSIKDILRGPHSNVSIVNCKEGEKTKNEEEDKADQEEEEIKRRLTATCSMISKATAGLWQPNNSYAAQRLADIVCTHPLEKIENVLRRAGEKGVRPTGILAWLQKGLDNYETYYENGNGVASAADGSPETSPAAQRDLLVSRLLSALLKKHPKAFVRTDYEVRQNLNTIAIALVRLSVDDIVARIEATMAERPVSDLKKAIRKLALRLKE